MNAIGSKLGKFKQTSMLARSAGVSALQRMNRLAYFTGSPKIACSGRPLIDCLMRMVQKSTPMLVPDLGSNSAPTVSVFDFSGCSEVTGRPIATGPALRCSTC